MARKRRLFVGRWACVMLAAVVLGPALHAQVTVPQYEVDPSWPKPLPDHWVLGGLADVCVDAQDHVCRSSARRLPQGRRRETSRAGSCNSTTMCCCPSCK